MADSSPPPPPPPRRYVSMFRIDGVPIMPPLMTLEKQRQMQKFREKAIKIEATLEERKRLRERLIADDTPQSSQNYVIGGGICASSSSDGSMSQQSFEFDIQRLNRERELHESYLILSDIVRQRETGDDADMLPSANSSLRTDNLNSLMQSSESNLTARVQKLTKSETIIYDNLTNTILMPMTDADYQHINNVNKEANLNESIAPKSIIDKQIPSIHVDPPTPLYDGGRDFGSSHSMYVDDISSEDSYVIKSLSSATAEVVMPSSSRSERLPRLEPEGTAPQRAATSPQLKQLPECITPNAILHTDTQNITQSEIPLVRSNSFTLTCPSKALLEHIRKQKAAGVQQRRSDISASAMRDTVESKAKRVQKVDLKSRSSPLRTSGAVQRRSNNSNSHSNCGAPSHSNSPNTVLLFRNKRSPYDSKISSKPKLARSHKKCTGLVGSCNSAITSYMNTANNNLNKSKTTNATTKNKIANVTVASTTTSNAAATPSQEENLRKYYESEHQQKLLQLIAQQEEEQMRLRASFEMQKQELLARLEAEMNEMHFPSAYRQEDDHKTSYLESEETSPNPKSECSEFKSSTASMGSSTNCTARSNISQIATTTINSNCSNSSTLIGTELPSLDLSSVSTSMTSAMAPMTTHRSTPRRRLFVAAPDGETADMTLMTLPSPPPPPPSQQAPNRCLSMERSNMEATAATIINAHARGFLVRRLFQTEQIQRIVQTIRDTLIFVLNLHMETLQNADEANTPANIKLKARLLQQLSSATRTLHLVFFQTTVKERMEIIARDRKRIKTKLMVLNLKRSPRIGSS